MTEPSIDTDDSEDDDVHDAIETFRVLAEANRKKAIHTPDEGQANHQRGAATAYDDAANHLEREVLDDGE